MQALDYYATHSAISDPGKFVYLYADLPLELPQLCASLRKLLFHYAEEELYEYKIPEDRFNECHLRTAEKILARLMQLKNAPLNKSRKLSERVISVCRDNALLVCSVLRHRKIPARVRVGFANYIIPQFNLDGMCVEYWDTNKRKWCYVDTRTSVIAIQNRGLNIDFDLMDLPQNKYIGAAEAWQLCRKNVISANRFGYGKYRGLWYIRNRMLQDFSNLNKNEVLLWDFWGLMAGTSNNYRKINAKQLIQLDELSYFIIVHQSDRSVDQICQFYQSCDPQLKMLGEVA